MRQERGKQRAHALMLLQENCGSIRAIAALNKVPRSTVNQIKTYLKSNNLESLNKLLDENCRLCDKAVLSAKQENIVVQRLLLVGSRGAAVGYNLLGV